MSRLLIVTVNYRTAALTEKCLRSVAAELPTLPETRMVIVDNDSGDGSFETIRAAIDANGWSDWAEVVQAERNGGFSYGNNYAIRPAMQSAEPPDLIWLLNPDAELLGGAGAALVDFLNRHPRAGMVTSQEVDDSGSPQPMAFRRFSAVGELVQTMRLGLLARLFPNAVVPIWPADEPFRADWLSGSSLMIRREVIQDLGLMDEGYFLYFEESDYCLQAQRKGWELWYVPQSRIFHVQGASTGFIKSALKQPRRPAYWFYSRRRYFVKNFGGVYAVVADALHLIGYAFWRVRRWVQNKPDLDPPGYLGDFFRNSVFVKGFTL
ncbi:MAG: glycosyltransferase family 2 protein [Thiotrichales bacterium]